MEVGGRLCGRGGFLSLQVLKSSRAAIAVTKQVGGQTKLKKIVVKAMAGTWGKEPELCLHLSSCSTITGVLLLYRPLCFDMCMTPWHFLHQSQFAISPKQGKVSS